MAMSQTNIRICYEETWNFEAGPEGETVSCGRTATGMRYDGADVPPYPVCIMHSRRPMVPLTEVGHWLKRYDSDGDEWK